MDGGARYTHEGSPTLNCEMAPGSIVTFYADGNLELIRMNHHLIELLGCDSVEDVLGFYHGSFREIVHVDDLPALVEFLQVLSSSPGHVAYTYFRAKTKEGVDLNVVAHGKVMYQEDSTRPVCNVFMAALLRFRTVDWLTGLPAIERFRQIARTRAAALQSSGLCPVAVAFDLTGFKGYNDRYGRDRGDETLRLFAQMLSDTFGRDGCSRFGEDHFYAIGEAETVEQKVVDLLTSYDLARLGNKPPVRAGLYACDSGEDIADAGFNRAKVACDLDRKTWNSHFTWFTDEMRTEERIRIHVLENLDRAIDEGWIRPYYQAIARSATNEICGEEALARWIDPEFGLLSPAQFIPVVEDAGVSHKLSLHMVDCVLADMLTKQSLGVPVVPVSVNFSVCDLVQMDIAHEIAQRADRCGIDHSMLIVEFTESVVSANPDLFRGQVVRLREAGFDVWMDDFGSGYSSLNTLREFDFDLVKIDMEFVRGLVGDHSERSRAIVSSILQGVGKMGLDTLAEGVETSEQALFLQAAGCNMLQGYLLSRPHPLETILAAAPGVPREQQEETSYWDAVGRVRFDDLYSAKKDGSIDVLSLYESPVGVVELRDGHWRALRANAAYRGFMEDTGLVPNCRERMLAAPIRDDVLDDDFLEAAQRSLNSGSWERVLGSLERGSGYQFYIKHLASSEHADAFTVASVPILLGSALGGFGDVPVAYAVFRVILDDAGKQVLDVIFAYANQNYLDWFDLEKGELTGRSFLKTVKNASTEWFPYCYRAVVLGETVHDVIYSPEIDHWLSFDIAPCTIDGYCILAFSIADSEQYERKALAIGLDTADLIIDIADAFGSETSYEVAMHKLLAALSRIAHARRVSLIERGEDSSHVAFEWCEEGTVPLISIMQGMDNAEFDEWERLTKTEPVIVVSDVEDSEGIDENRLGDLNERGVTHIMAVPVKNDNETLGYLVIDNYELDDDLDVLRLLESVASFVGTRMANHRLVEELKRTSLRDALTGLYNRRGIDLAVEKQMSERPGEPYVLALMDIDDFKTVNDVHGHDVGDVALRTLARVVKESFPPEAIVGRNGGDEFLVFLYGCGLGEAERLVKALLSKGLSGIVDGERYQLSMSVGLASYPDYAQDLMDAYSKADKALYAVKLAGKSGWKSYSPDMERQYRLQLGFTPRDIAEGIPGAVIVHQPTGDGAILFVNDEALHLFECDDLADFMNLTGGVFGGVVHPDDADYVCKLLGQQMTLDDVGKKDYASYRIVTKRGNVRHVIDCGRLVEVEGLGKLFYELIINDDERRQALGL